jgi:multimeric flavodoxin WrbA
MSRLTPRKGMPSPRLNEGEFRKRFLAQFQDPAFDSLARELDSIVAAAWDAYSHSRKAPHTRKAGTEFADPDYDLSVDWLAARAAIADAQRRHADRTKPAILLINCSSRSEHTCPGEMSKSYRLVEIAREVFAAAPGVAIELLDLSRLASEYGRHIHPCKACFSTAAALCHWPCSCYPNYSLGQTQDWMNEIYPMWVAAHGIMIITPVNWYQVSSPLKLMMDRLVCADGGNPDPTRTQGARQGRGAGEADRARGLGLPPASRGSAVLRRRAWRRRGRRERATEHFRLALLHAPLCRGSDGRTRSLHRLLEALCHQPRRSRRRFCRSRGGAQRRPHVTRGGARQARRQVRNRGRRLAGAAAKVSFGPRQALDASQRVYRRGDERALKNSRLGARRPRPVCLVWACSKLQEASVD